MASPFCKHSIRPLLPPPKLITVVNFEESQLKS